MARTLSQDLRDRVVGAIDGGLSCHAAAARFGVSVSSAIRWRRLALEHCRAVANMERPGLKRLMADVAAGKVDIILVYKIDRLTRSLADFAKIVDVLDTAKASFVSITQSFNTTTSMGRLTLNMLLSFAQFEREVTGERIRDKIAASKRKGMWMGGPLPLGYDVENRRLVVNSTEADLVRQIYQRYLELGSVVELADDLNVKGYKTKVQQKASGPHRGGCAFRRGTLYHLLSNPIYRGKIVHKGEVYPGEHEAIVPEDLFQAVQDKLKANASGTSRRLKGQQPSLLTGILQDSDGRAMTPSHASKGKAQRYRYYVTRSDQTKDEPAYVAHSLEASLWSVARSGTFAEAVLLAANLGEDADTTAAITGQLAGGLHGASAIPKRWLERQAWNTYMVEIADQLFEYE